MKEKRVVQVGKIDLDTCGACFLLGVSRADEVVVLRGEAAPQDLANPEVICIEVGGSGQTQLNNWDHHGPGAQVSYHSATKQVWLSLGETWEERFSSFANTARQAGLATFCNSSPWAVSNLVEYINELDTQGAQALGQSEREFPFLSDLFSGLLLTERDPVEQLHEGVRLLADVVGGGWDPHGSLKGLREPWAAAKAENNRQVAKAARAAQWGITSAGLRLAWLETDFIGAPGALYEAGAQVVVVFNRHFGPAGVPKFTIATNSSKVDAVLPELIARESGWGGPPTGTIIGSPREGSRLTLSEVVDIVRRGL